MRQTKGQRHPERHAIADRSCSRFPGLIRTEEQGRGGAPISILLREMRRLGEEEGTQGDREVMRGSEKDDTREIYKTV